MNRFRLSVGSYVSICLMGFVTGLANGTHWGTPEAGSTTAVTFLVASIVTIALATFPGDI